MKQPSIKSFFGKPSSTKTESSPSSPKKDTHIRQVGEGFEREEGLEQKKPKLEYNSDISNNSKSDDETEVDTKTRKGKKNTIESDSEQENQSRANDSPEISKEKEEENEIAHKLATEATLPINKVSTDSSSLKYADLCQCFEKVEKTTKRLEITKILTDFLIQVIEYYPDQLIQVIYLCINRIAPDYEGLELKIGESILLKAIAQATGNTDQMIKTKYQKIGDLGQLAYDCRKDQKTLYKPKELLVGEVFKTYRDIAKISGHSSMKLKIDKIVKMLVSCRDQEAKFLMRSLNESLRIGLAEKTILTSLAQASVLANKKKNTSKDKLESDLIEAVEIIKSVYSEMPNYEMIIPAILEHGIKQLSDHCKLTPGIPVKPMLAHPTKSISEVLNRFENTPFTCEYKYDGERAQIHRDENGKIKIFSRNAEDSTPKYPDVLEQVENFTKPDTTTFILDCEAVAWDSETQEILPFNILTTRKRKDVQVKDIKVKVCLFAFDLLNLNGKSLLRTPLEDRRKLLFEHFQEVSGVFTFAKSMVSDDVEEISEFLDQSIRDKCEGLMVKVLQNEESSYEPSKRSRNWLKVKKDYMNTIGDTLDLVVIGAYYGKGKRANTYGKYLLACYNPKDESYQSICKIGTGFTDADLLSHYEELQPHIISKPRPDYSFSTEKSPDVWFSPSLVWEIKAADLSISPIYKAGIGEVDDTKGISLRFPRYIKNREKKPEDASETSLVVDMYKNQSILQPNSNGQAFADDDFEY